MSMGENGRAQVYKEISKRLDDRNIDRVAMALSSNACENFYGMLTKYTHGKRINYGQTDSWAVFGLYVAGKKSDDRFEDKVQQCAGIQSSYVRDSQIDKSIAVKENHREREKREDVKERQKVRQMAKIKECQKNMRVAGRHRPNSLSPKDNCKSTNTGLTTKKKRRTRCKNPNCGLLHNSADECQWPKLDSHEVKSKRMTKRQKKIEEQVARFDDIVDLID